MLGLEGWLQVIISSILGGLLSGGSLTAIFLYYRSKTDNTIKALKEDVRHIRDEQLKKVETKIECHIEQDQAQKILTEIKHLVSKVELMSNKLDATREENASQRSDIKNNNDFIKNVNASLQDHKNQPHK